MGTNFAVAPGEYLQEWIDGNGMSVGEFAVELGVTVAEIEDLLTGKEAIGREIAYQLERVTSIPSDSWIRFELKYREDLKRMSVGSEESCTSSIHDELASLFRQGGRSWVPVYLLMRDVSENELYKPEYSSFSAWLKDEAARCGVTETLLWQRKSAGDFYHEWSSGKTGVPSLEDGKHLSELNLNLVRKIAKIDPSRGDELMYEMIEAGLSTKMLRSEWRAVRSHEDGKGIGDATKTCYADAVGRKISCSDSETFEEIVNILRSAGLICSPYGRHEWYAEQEKAHEESPKCPAKVSCGHEADSVSSDAKEENSVMSGKERNDTENKIDSTDETVFSIMENGPESSKPIMAFRSREDAAYFLECLQQASGIMGGDTTYSIVDLILKN